MDRSAHALLFQERAGDFHSTTNVSSHMGALPPWHPLSHRSALLSHLPQPSPSIVVSHVKSSKPLHVTYHALSFQSQDYLNR